MKKLLVLILSFTMVSAVMAKENETKKTTETESQSVISLTGTVLDSESKESLTGVEVRIEGTDLKAYTDFDGSFSFSHLPAGEYKVITNYISYQKHSEVLKLGTKQTQVEIKLSSSK